MDRKSATDRAVLAQIPAARRRAQRTAAAEPRVMGVRHDGTGRRVHLTLSNGAELVLPLSLFPQLEGASAAALAKVRITAAGLGVEWPELDQDVSVAGVLRAVVGPRALLRMSGAAGGASRSVAKRAAARRNGRRGGRPRKGVHI